MIAVLDDQLSDVVLVQRSYISEKQRYNKILEKNLEDLKRRMIVQED